MDDYHQMFENNVRKVPTEYEYHLMQMRCFQQSFTVIQGRKFSIISFTSHRDEMTHQLQTPQHGRQEEKDICGVKSLKSAH